MATKKTPILKDVQMRAKEEFAVYFPKALAKVDQRELGRMGIRMANMVDVFRTVYMDGFIDAAIIQLQELPKPFCQTAEQHAAKVSMDYLP